MKLSQFKFKLPEEQIALEPPCIEFTDDDGNVVEKVFHRDECRLMVIHRKSQKIEMFKKDEDGDDTKEYLTFRDVVNYFDEGDVFVFNDTKVFPARLYGTKEKTDAKIEVFLLRELNRDQRLWDVLVEPARKIRIGNKLFFEDDGPMVAEVIDNTTSRGRTLRFLYDCPHDEFKAELDDVINSLREEGDILHNRRALAKYCYCTPQSRMQEEPGYYGVRVDTGKYAYLLRLNPDRGEYNLYCYCYRRDWLDQHLKDAEKGIRFIDSHYKELFRIPDGGKVKIHYSWNEDQIRTCRYIDDYHVEIGSNLYHICEFAERMEYGGHTCEPIRDNLPEQCYSVLSGSDEIIIIKRGEKGYFKTDIPVTDKDEARSIANEYNAKLGVSRAQEEAMKAGSMFGFQVPAADPRNYDADGKPVMPKDRGDAR